ncbi:MAG: iron-containing alcohol dehydrogenase [Devosiaceae bacterium]|nr:iron-containing alcohol dehydrogenase [Devosiaceae bacterium]
MELVANWNYPTPIRFGAGRISELVETIKLVGMKNPLFVTDKGLANLPITQNALDLMDKGGFGRACFFDVDVNPNDINLSAGVDVFLQGKHDGVIAFGGGSALDLGKLIAFQARQSRPIWDFEDIGDYWTRADESAIAPIIAIPTTAGTGSEVGRAGVLTNSQTHVKKIIFHPKILPQLVICDPELSIGMPQIITVGTGMDAFIHSLEAYSSPFYHPMSQGIALEGMRLVKENLGKVYANPNDIEARSHMMAAAAMGATAFQKGLGAMHALSHSVGALYNTPHGMTNAIVMPYVLKFNREAIEQRIENLAAYLDIKGGFDGFYKFIMQMRSDFEVPQKLNALGVDDKRIDELAQMAVNDPSAGGNPVELTLEAAKTLFEEAI